MKKLSKDAESKILTALESVADSVNEGTNPNDAIVKAASTHDIPAGHINLMVSAYNTGRTGKQRMAGGDPFDKAATFELANSQDIMSRLYPTHVKSAAQKRDETIIDDEYSQAPVFAQHKKAAHVAARDIDWKMVDKPAEYPGEAHAPVKRALDTTIYDKRRLEECRREVSSAQDRLSQNFEKLSNYFRTPGGVSFDDACYVAELHHGGMGSAVMNQVARNVPQFNKKAKDKQPAGQMPRHDCHGVHPDTTHEEWVAQQKQAGWIGDQLMKVNPFTYTQGHGSEHARKTSLNAQAKAQNEKPIVKYEAAQLEAERAKRNKTTADSGGGKSLLEQGTDAGIYGKDRFKEGSHDEHAPPTLGDEYDQGPGAAARLAKKQKRQKDRKGAYDAGERDDGSDEWQQKHEARLAKADEKMMKEETERNKKASSLIEVQPDQEPWTIIQDCIKVAADVYNSQRALTQLREQVSKKAEASLSPFDPRRGRSVLGLPSPITEKHSADRIPWERNSDGMMVAGLIEADAGDEGDEEKLEEVGMGMHEMNLSEEELAKAKPKDEKQAAWEATGPDTWAEIPLGDKEWRAEMEEDEEIRKQEASIDEQYEPYTGQRDSSRKWKEQAQEAKKKEEAEEKEASLFALSHLFRNVNSGVANAKAKEESAIEDYIEELDDPIHTEELKRIQIRAQIENMMANDEFISRHPAEEVSEAYNEIVQLAPRAADSPLLMRNMLRDHLKGIGGEMDVRDINANILGAESALKGTQSAETPAPAAGSQYGDRLGGRDTSYKALAEYEDEKNRIGESIAEKENILGIQAPSPAGSPSVLPVLPTP